MSRAWPTVIAKIPDSVRHSAGQDQVLAGFWRIWVTPLQDPCHCFRDLRMRREAVEQAQRAVDSTDPKYARTLGFCRMVLARSQLLNGELEAAVTTAGLAVDGGEPLQSSRFQSYVTDFQQEVSAHAANPAVAAFNERVAGALARLDDDE